MCKTRTMRREGSALAGSELTVACSALDAIVVNGCLGRLERVKRVVLVRILIYWLLMLQKNY